MNVRMIVLAGSVASLLSVSACSQTKETLGLVKQTPDEFKIVKRAPLAMPPEYSLRPPRAGAPRPQEQSMDEEARQAVFGGNNVQKAQSASSAEELLLQEIGAEQADPEIRDKVAQDLSEHEEKQQPIGTRLLGIGGNKEADADVVNAAEESERLHGGDKDSTAASQEAESGADTTKK